MYNLILQYNKNFKHTMITIQLFNGTYWIYSQINNKPISHETLLVYISLIETLDYLIECFTRRIKGKVIKINRFASIAAIFPCSVEMKYGQSLFWNLEDMCSHPKYSVNLPAITVLYDRVSPIIVPHHLDPISRVQSLICILSDLEEPGVRVILKDFS